MKRTYGVHYNPVENAAILNEAHGDSETDSVPVHGTNYTRETVLPNDVSALFSRLGFKGPRRRA